MVQKVGKYLTGRFTDGGNPIIAINRGFYPNARIENGEMNYCSIELFWREYELYPNGFERDLGGDYRKVYTNDNKRIDLNLETMQPIPAEEGEENINGFKVIGAIDFWKKTPVYAAIIEDLNYTMNHIFPQPEPEE